jgi:hypothetical protein
MGVDTSKLGPAFLALLLLVLAACAPGANELVGVPDAEGAVAGFWMGLWHGLIAPVTFLISLFSDSVEMYEAHNNGGWYNFGFLIGLTVPLGGGARSGAKRRRRAGADSP